MSYAEQSSAVLKPLILNELCNMRGWDITRPPHPKVTVNS